MPPGAMPLAARADGTLTESGASTPGAAGQRAKDACVGVIDIASAASSIDLQVIRIGGRRHVRSVHQRSPATSTQADPRPEEYKP